MVDASHQLLVQIVSTIEGRLAKMDETYLSIRTEIRAMREHIIAMQTDTANLYAAKSKLESCLERIEHKLELDHAQV